MGGVGTLRHGRYCWLLYSANACEHEDYFTGTTVAENRRDLREMFYRKYPSADQWKPLLRKNAKADGTGLYHPYRKTELTRRQSREKYWSRRRDCAPGSSGKYQVLLRISQESGNRILKHDPVAADRMNVSAAIGSLYSGKDGIYEKI